MSLNIFKVEFDVLEINSTWVQTWEKNLSSFELLHYYMTC